jgi:hypothetical protein
MTDPTGRSFLSYRRKRSDEAALLINAQHDHGIPTWQDIHNLDELPTEDELRRILDDPLTANAVLWITREVEDSAMIRQVEAPKILSRAAQRNQFFVIPCAAGGLDYDEAATVVDAQISLQNLKEWNLRKISTDPIEPREAQEIAQRVLSRRLRAVHDATAAGLPLRLGLFTRTPPPFEPGVALRLDWSGRFTGREASHDVWQEHLIPALKAVAQRIRADAPGRAVEAFGLPCIPAAVALGCAFLAPSGSEITWLQYTPGRDDQRWSLRAARESSGFVAATQSRSVTGTECAVLVSVTTNIEPAFAASQKELPQFRSLIHVRHPETFRYDVATPGQAADIAHTVIEAMHRMREEYCPTGAIHLFMAVPIGLAMLIGQLLNTFGAVQLYEHCPEGAVGVYRPAVQVHPSV